MSLVKKTVDIRQSKKYSFRKYFTPIVRRTLKSQQTKLEVTLKAQNLQFCFTSNINDAIEYMLKVNLKFLKVLMKNLK